MAYTIIIPARLASTRLPNKPLADIAGLPMVIRTAMVAQKTGARLVVAADSTALADVCSAHNIECCITDPALASGTDRVAQAASLLGLPDDAVVINLQCDEPMMDARIIEAVAAHLLANADEPMATAAHRLRTPEDMFNPNAVKVVLNQAQKAMYFSRAPIPWLRDAWGQVDDWATLPSRQNLNALSHVLRHVGVYGYHVQALKSIRDLPPSPLEGLEMLEQLRVLYHGINIHVTETPYSAGIAVDTLPDLAAVRAFFA